MAELMAGVMVAWMVEYLVVWRVEYLADDLESILAVYSVDGWVV